MRTVAAAGCSAGAVAASANPDSFAVSWKLTEPATGLVIAGHWRLRLNLGCSSSCGVTG